jgi:carboxyl-terminal processing protease
MQLCPWSRLASAVSTGLLALTLLLSPSIAPAQSEVVRISAEALATADTAVLERGIAFEQQNRWADALAHYEEAVRKFPQDRQLQQRFDVARMHYSIERRYTDQSFVQAIRGLTAQQSADLYADLLAKIDAHYVSEPAWNDLVRRGVDSLEVALTKTDFIRSNGVEVNSQRLGQLNRELRTLLHNRPVQNRRDAANMASAVAQVAARQVGLSPSATALEFTAAAAGGLDSYSAYLTGDQLKEIYSQIKGNFVGLGVELKDAAGGGLEIVHVIPGSPAERANIQSGDVITEIDGRALAGMTVDAAAGLLTGEEGSVVEVRVVPTHNVAKPVGDTAPRTRSPFVARVRREHVDVPAIEDAKIIDPAYGVGYVRIPVFQETTARDLETTLWDLYHKQMKSLVIDLRGNPGGLLTSSVELADKFVAEGRIVSTRGRSAGEDFDYRAHRPGTWRVPLVVLIDDQSASASEIFAAAIHDNRRGAIVGQRSFGKGTVQGIFPLGYAGAGIRLTTAKFYSPNGQPISQVGVEPDIVVRHATGETEQVRSTGYRGVDLASDPALSKAVEAARGQVALK